MTTGMRHALRWGLTFGGATLLFLLIALWQATAVAAATTFTVTTTADNTTTDTICTLREALLAANGAAANTDCGADTGAPYTVAFNIPGAGVQQITVGSALPSLIRNMTIDGSAQPIVVDGNSKGAVFTIGSGEEIATFNGLTIQHGSGNNHGGGPFGGGIDNNLSGTVNVTNCTIANNSVTGGGGGIWNSGGGTVTVTGSTFSGNSASGGFGGGGILSVGINTTVTVTNSTFTGNTVSSNSGGGISLVNGGTVNVSFSTFSGNGATLGGGIFIQNSGTVTLKNTIVANSTSGGDLATSGGGTFTSADYNLVQNPNGVLTPAAHDITGVSPMLASLGAYGGPTQTFALLPGSPALNYIPSANCTDIASAAVTIDQRAISRPQPAGGNCDIGAVEMRGFTLTPSGTPQSANTGSAFAAPLVATLTETGGSALPGVAITFTAFANDSATGTLGTPNPVTTTASGQASITATAGSVPGQYSVQASATGVATPANFTLLNVGACVVTSTQGVAEAGKVTLLDAVNALNAGGCTNNTVNFDDTVFPPTTPKTITIMASPYDLSLTTSPPSTIDGTGHKVVIDGSHVTALFFVEPGVTATLLGLTMQHGFSSDGGGAIFNQGTLTVQNCTFDSNDGGFSFGGAIENMDNLTVVNSSFTNNTAGDGGAIDSNTGVLSITGSTFQNNHAAQPAVSRAVAPKAGRTKTISRPVRSDGFTHSGGALFLCSCVGAATITNSTFTGNTATVNGGAIIAEAPLSLVNVTIVGNSANKGGGVYVSALDGGRLTAVNALIAGNTLTGSRGAGPDVNGTFQEASKNNLIGDGSTTGLTNGTSGNQVGTTASPINPLVGPIGNYGGTTQTIPLLPGSPAIDAGAPVGGTVPPTDQRGKPRVNAPDIGAFESQGFTLTPSGTPQSTTLNAPFAQPLGVTVTPKNAGDPVAGGVISFAITPAASGATATLSAAMQTINGSGQASVNATANGIADTYTATASAAGAAPATFNLTNVVIAITPGTLPNGTSGNVYPGQMLIATGGTGPYTFTLLSGTLPPGLTLKPDGTLSGTTTTGGAYTFTVQAKDANGVTGTQQYTINVATLVSLVVTYNGSTTPTVKVGQIAPFIATAVYSDNTQIVVTTQATWSSDGTTYATVEATTGKVVGQVPNGAVPLHIKAVFGELSGQATVTVTPPTGTAITVGPSPASRPSGTTSGSGSPAPNPAPIAPPSGGTTPGPAPAPVPGGR